MAKGQGQVPSMEREDKPGPEEPNEVDVKETPGQKLDEWPKYAPDDFDIIAKELIEVPFKIRALETKLIGHMRKSDGIAKRKKQIEGEIFAKVNSETVVIGKPGEEVTKQVYTNKEARDIETQKRCHKDHAEYSVLNKEEQDNVEKQQHTKADLDLLRRQLRSIEILVELQKVKFRM